MIAVLISIRPKWCEKIISGEKTIEVRKTRPKMNPPFKCYIYCTKPEEKLITIMKDGDENYGETYHGKPVFIKTEKAPTTGLWDKRQKVIGEFVCDDIFERIVRVGAICEPPKYCICRGHGPDAGGNQGSIYGGHDDKSGSAGAGSGA